MSAGLILDHNARLPDDGWVDVKGRLHFLGQSKFPIIQVDSIDLIQPPADPYLYSQAVPNSD
jgi:uncharacterized membrane protein YcgQ (UPF0703/DUF1980 family)